MRFIFVGYARIAYMEFYRYAFLFLFGGFIGWLIELFFRRFVSQKKWVNPGFLTGPFLPLYGFGTIGFYFMCSLHWKEWITPAWFAVTVEIIAIGALMTLLEYVAGIIFIKGMKIKLWDYSSRWGNIQGIICPLFSLIWLACGAAYLFLIHPLMVSLSSLIMDESHILVYATLIGFALGLLTLDFGYSMHLATRIRKAVAESWLVVDWDRIKIYMQENAKKVKAKAPIFFAFSEKVASLPSVVKEYAAKLQETPKAKAALARENARIDKRNARLAAKAEKKAAKKLTKKENRNA